MQVVSIQICSPKMCVPVSTAGTPNLKSLWQLDLNKSPQGWTGDGHQHDQEASGQPSSASHSNSEVKAQLSERIN